MDYGIFKLSNMNRYRGVNQNHVEKMKQSILEKNLLASRPILVGKDHIVLDGQHRLEAAKSLGIPIYYHYDENLTEEDMISLTGVNLAWTTEDKLNYYAKKGNADCQKILDISKKYGLETSLVFTLLCPFRNAIVKADFKISSVSLEIGEDYIEYFFKCRDIVKLCLGQVNFFTANRCVSALYSLYRMEEFDKEHFLRNLKSLSHLVCMKPSKVLYVKMFLEIYNFKKKSKKLMVNEEND